MNNPNIKDFFRFMNSFKGNPQSAQQKVEELLKSGKMTNTQFQELQQRATQFQNQFNIK